jgi:hypothetical protein
VPIIYTGMHPSFTALSAHTELRLTFATLVYFGTYAVYSGSPVTSVGSDVTSGLGERRAGSDSAKPRKSCSPKSWVGISGLVGATSDLKY